MRTAAMIAALGVGLAACGGSSERTSLTEDSGSEQTIVTEDDRDPSVARIWNEVLLEGIRNDFARPTVHARNLWHVSAAMYDAWAAFDDTSSTWLLGKTQNNSTCLYNAPTVPRDRHVAREEAISFAAYRIIRRRFENSPGAVETAQLADDTMVALGYDSADTSTAYELGSPSALGNYIADCYLAYGLSDGANEANDYASIDYMPFNPPLAVEEPGNPAVFDAGFDLNRWQQIQLTVSIDQSGNIVDEAPPFVSPEWGAVHPFSMTAADRSTCQRAGFDYPVYLDPGPPPRYIEDYSAYKWTHAFVARVSSQLVDPAEPGASVPMIDISPGNLGNIQSYPTNFAETQTFYERMLVDGTTADTGYDINPATGAPYAAQLVPLSDYARVIAEFWADGPESETPPGHWFVIVNEISDHPELEKRFEGVGPELGPLEWDIKIYFALGGSMHDAAISAWSLKGCYDYIRPVSAIRAMADLGQSSDPMRPSYHVDGIPLEPGHVELVELGDMIYKPQPPSGSCPTAVPAAAEDVGKIRLLAWRGPCAINNANFDEAGVGWILAENWWPYQRPTFVTPPFAGYVSGHSTYSRTAAELLALFTGDEYFPGGKSEFPAEQDRFLVFEDGPSVGLTLEWAKYVDASDQCSLSRIWGGIHPPADDIPGRRIGMVLGPQAFLHARDYINGTL